MTAEEKLKELYSVEEKKWGEGTYTTTELMSPASNSSIKPEVIDLIANLVIERLRDKGDD